jgi:site-specific recombinase XerD
MSTIKTIIRIDKKNKNNECPIVFRFIKNRRATYIASNIIIPIDKWDPEKGAIKRSHPMHRQLNAELKIKVHELNTKYTQLKVNKPKANKINIKKELEKYKPIHFIQFANELNEQYKNELNTYLKVNTIINKFRLYLAQQNMEMIELHAIDAKMINDYEIYLRIVKNNKINTIATSLNYLKQIFGEAVKRNLIKYEDNPFMYIKIKLEKTNKTYLTDEEINTIENYPFEKGSKLDIARDAFVFASDCGGIRISDIITMKVKNYDGQFLNFIMQKTNKQIQLKVPIRAKKIIEKYIFNKNKEMYIFPIIKNNIDINDAYEVKKSIKIHTQLIDKRLKIIAKATNINKNISMHISRHTFATRALIKGVSVEILQKILGHRDLDSTMVYAKIINSELDKAMDLF